MGDNSPNISNGKENQALRPSIILAFMALLGAFALILSPIVRNSQEQAHIQSIALAQSVGYQAWEIEKRRILLVRGESKGGRGPSSVEGGPSTDDVFGTLGKDPLGQPFKYKIRTEGQRKVVDIWSEGPNAVRTQVLIPVEASEIVQVSQ